MLENKKTFFYDDKFITIEKSFSIEGNPVTHVTTNIYGIEEEFDIGAFSIEARDEMFDKMNAKKTKEMICGLLNYFEEKAQLEENKYQSIH